MDGVIKMDDARALVADPALWPRMRNFLWDFAKQVHPSWLEGLESSGAVDGDRRVGRRAADMLDSCRVRRFVLERLGVKPFFHAFPKDDLSRLALLDGACLESIVKWLGALACADSLRRVTDGASVRRLKSALSGVYPEVFSFTAYFKGLDSESKGSAGVNDADGVVGAGCSLFGSLVSDLPAQVGARIRLKMPKSFFAGAQVEGGAHVAGSSLKASLSKLLKLKFPEAHSLCC